MNNEELKNKVCSAAYNILNTQVFIAPVDVLMAVGVLSRKDYEDWRFGRIPYLEKVCKANLSKLSLIMKELKGYARQNNLKPSWTAYNKWGKGRKIPLRFSKSGDPKIEEAYSTHFVDLNKIENKNELKGLRKIAKPVVDEYTFENAY